MVCFLFRERKRDLYKNKASTLLRFDVSQLPRRNIFNVGCGVRRVSQVALVINNLSARAGDIRHRVGKICPSNSTSMYMPQSEYMSIQKTCIQ